jgi:hypothetical protein
MRAVNVHCRAAEGNARLRAAEIARHLFGAVRVRHAYLRWMLTQGVHSENAELKIGRGGWLWGVKALHSRRSPARPPFGFSSLETFHR